MRKLLIGGMLAVLVVALSACGGSSGNSASEQALERKADIYAISQIERSFHESTSKREARSISSATSSTSTPARWQRSRQGISTSPRSAVAG